MQVRRGRSIPIGVLICEWKCRRNQVLRTVCLFALYSVNIHLTSQHRLLESHLCKLWRGTSKKCTIVGLLIPRQEGFGGAFKTVALFSVLKSKDRSFGHGTHESLGSLFPKIRSWLPINSTPRKLKKQQHFSSKGEWGQAQGRGVPAFNVFPPHHSCTLWRCICEIARISGVTQLRTETRPWVIWGSEPEIPRADDTQHIGPDSASSQQASEDHLRPINPVTLAHEASKSAPNGFHLWHTTWTLLYIPINSHKPSDINFGLCFFRGWNT